MELFNEYYGKYAEFAKPYGEMALEWVKPPGYPAVVPLEDWPLTSFEIASFIAVCYLTFVFVGRIVMSVMPPVKGLYPLKFLYNITQVMLCSWMAIQAGVAAYQAGYTLIPCNPQNFTNPPIGFVLYVFYLSKILDFMDTIFIILEKKWKQLTFLHVYHHTSIFLFYWLNTHVGFDGDVYLTIVLNGLVHTIMYTYYFVSMHTSDIWWKRALTMGQMVQFVVMNAQAAYLLYSECPHMPKNLITAYGYYILSMLALFMHFFITSYGGKKPKTKKA